MPALLFHIKEFGLYIGSKRGLGRWRLLIWFFWSKTLFTLYPEKTGETVTLEVWRSVKQVFAVIHTVNDWQPREVIVDREVKEFQRLQVMLSSLGDWLDIWDMGGAWVKNDSHVSDRGSHILNIHWDVWQKEVDFDGKDDGSHFGHSKFEIPGRCSSGCPVIDTA